MKAGLTPLREELLLHPAPRSHDGAPAWTLEDPGRNLFFQIGWAEAEILSRWRLRSPQRIVDGVNRDTTLEIVVEDVDALSRFLDAQHLLQQRGPEACERFQRDARTGKEQNWARWALHHYLFFRLPLVRPDAFLDRSLPWVRRCFLNRRFARLTALAGLLGLFLVTRQWDTFLHTFLHFFTLEGAAVAALVLGCTKVLHELGHAYMAKHHGCRVASMGIAFMVMWPVLYTDTSGAWRLQSRRKRMAIGAAGMLTETALAAWATLAWSFLPDGMLRSAAFMLATTTWLLTLAVNLNPLMRFDGYFLLSDALNVPNLQNRAFALARWRLREWLFRIGEDRPEVFAPWRERALLLYAFLVWIYRFFLFLGIALLVYHFAFKLLGIVLFIIEIVVFVMRPIYTELKYWWQHLRATGGRMNRRSQLTLALAGLALLACLLPWQTRVQAPALVRAAAQAQLVAPADARIEQIRVQAGQAVDAGQALFVLSAPDLDHERQSLQRRIDVLHWQRDFHGVQQDTLSTVPVALRELQAAQARLAVLDRQQSQLTLTAPFAGTVADRAEPLSVGEWVSAGEWLGTLASPERRLAEAYVTEQDLHRIQADNLARFVPDDPSQPALALRVRTVATFSSKRLGATPELASVHGGGIAAVQAPPSHRAESSEPGDAWVPEQAIYRVVLDPVNENADGPAALQALRGTVLIDGEAESLFRRAWRQIVSVLVRESGF